MSKLGIKIQVDFNLPEDEEKFPVFKNVFRSNPRGIGKTSAMLEAMKPFLVPPFCSMIVPIGSVHFQNAVRRLIDEQERKRRDEILFAHLKTIADEPEKSLVFEPRDTRPKSPEEIQRIIEKLKKASLNLSPLFCGKKPSIAIDEYQKLKGEIYNGKRKRKNRHGKNGKRRK